MGINLREVLECKIINMKDLSGKTLAIDALNMIYQFLSSVRQPDGTPLMDSKGNITSHLSGLFYRCSNLMENNIKLIFVFDGDAPELKEGTAEERRKIREAAKIAWEAAKKRGDIEEAAKWAQRSTKVDAEIIEESKRILDLMGIPWVQAPGEGEAQAAFMNQTGDAWAVVTQDYDAFLFGAKKVVRNLAMSKNKEIELLDLDENLQRLGISRERLVELAVLVGTDFNEGVKGIGPKTGLKIVRKNLFEDEAKKGNITNADQIKEIFLQPSLKTEYKLELKGSQADLLKEFLLSHDFSENRIQKNLEKLKPAQKNLSKWFC